MNTSQAQIVKSVFAALARGDMAGAASHFDSNIRIYEAESLPYGGEYVGHQGFFGLFEKLANTFDNLNIPPTIVVEAGPVVIALTALNAKSKATGAKISMPLNEIFVLRNDKVVEIRPFYWDTAQINAALLDSRDAIVQSPWSTHSSPPIQLLVTW